MFESEITYNLYTMLAASLEKPLAEVPEYIEEFVQNNVAILQKQFHKQRGNEFRLSMSSIGKPLRQLCLERDYGKPPIADPTFKLLVSYGDIIESLMVYLLRLSGANIEGVSGKVQLNLRPDVVINGEYDIIIDGKVYDIKSCSPWAFEHKMSNYESLAYHDTLGYVAQGFGYAKAVDKKFGGLIVVNKVNGNFKVVEVPAYIHDREMEKYLKLIEDNYDHVTNNLPAPPCNGVEDEFFRKKPTGNKILNKTCEFCDYKFSHCWENLRHLPALASDAKTPGKKFYTHIDPKWEGKLGNVD